MVIEEENTGQGSDRRAGEMTKWGEVTMTKFSIRRWIGALFAAGSLLAFGATAEAQTTAAPPNATALKAATAAYQQKLNALDPLLNTTVARFNTLAAHLTSAKLVQEADLQDAQFETQGMAYANAMKAAFEEAQTDAQTAGNSQGRQGNVGNLQAFETLAKDHEAKLQPLATQAQAIQAQLTAGTIRVDPALLQKRTPAEQQQYEKRSSIDFWQRFALLISESRSFAGIQASPSSIGKWCMSKVAGSIVTPAEASVIAPCVSSCLAENWGGCVSCVVAGGSSAINYWNNTFVPCWNGQGKPWWMPRWAWDVFDCLPRLIANLA
jgi:hypothetical protein